MSQKSLTSEGSQLYPFLVIYSNVFLDGIIVCEERISTEQDPFAASSARLKLLWCKEANQANTRAAVRSGLLPPFSEKKLERT